MQNLPRSGNQNAGTGYNGYSTAKKSGQPHGYQQPKAKNPSVTDAHRVTVERIKPLNPSQARARVTSLTTTAEASAKSSSKKHEKNPYAMRDYLFGLAVGLAVFGIAAIIICSVLIGIFL